MLKHHKSHLTHFTWTIVLALAMSACDFFDPDNIGAESAAQMWLESDTIYAMEGDTFSILPYFSPDTINITDLFILSSAEDVVAVRAGQLIAVGEGVSKLYIQSVSARLLDSCFVFVMKPWELYEGNYPYETVFYANVTVNGQPPTDDMTVAAFVGRECRAIGRWKTYYGTTMMLLRVGSETLYDETAPYWDEDEPDDPDALSEEGEDNGYDENEEESDESGGYVTPYRERISFRCYDQQHHKLYYAKQQEYFDGETHGTLSALYNITF